MYLIETNTSAGKKKKRNIFQNKECVPEMRRNGSYLERLRLLLKWSKIEENDRW